MLQITNLTFNAWGRQFLDDASVSLPPGSKVGLVGRNGIGKSTLFKIILGELAGNGDEVSLPRTARIGSGCSPPRALRIVATWSMLTPRRRVIPSDSQA